MFHTVVQKRFLRNGEKYYIYFLNNLLLFATVKDFSKSVNSNEVIVKGSTARFFLRHSVHLIGGYYAVRLSEGTVKSRISRRAI